MYIIQRKLYLVVLSLTGNRYGKSTTTTHFEHTSFFFGIPHAIRVRVANHLGRVLESRIQVERYVSFDIEHFAGVNF